MAEARVQPSADVPLAPLTTLGVGGPARWYVRAESLAMLRSALEWAGERAASVFVLGGGSNIVVADAGWPGLALHVAVQGIEFADEGERTRVIAGAGEPWDRLVAACVERGFAGIECLSGIPGTVGGTPVQNVGAYGQEVASVTESVEVFDRAAAAFRVLSAAECEFEYRMSRFKREPHRFVVCRVTFALRRAEPTIAYPDVIAWLRGREIMSPGLADVRTAVIDIRRRKGMVLDPGDPDTRSVGSFFVNPVIPRSQHEALAARFGSVPSFTAGASHVKVPAAWLIEHAGIPKGFRLGTAGVSSKHPLALINAGGAAAHDIVSLAVTIKRAVLEHCGVVLRPEPIFVGFGDDERVTYLQEAHS